MSSHTVIVGAGVGGLSAALALGARGERVTVLERAASPGGKLREVDVGGARMDAGPTVFTMRWVFEELFALAGLSFADWVSLRPAQTLARHAWTDGSHLDLHANLARSEEAIGGFAGAAEARRFLRFAGHAAKVYRALEAPFMRQPCASPFDLVRAAGWRGLGQMVGISPFETLWQGLGGYFHDPRLRQLFGRYATYCGSSPFHAPATLMLVAHVEQDGVWLVDGGMHALAQALARAAASKGVEILYGAQVASVGTAAGRVSGVALQSGESLQADAVIVNADGAAAASGLFGREVARALPQSSKPVRSLSAITWNLLARSRGVDLLRHSVFFADDYEAEFAALFGRGEVPEHPTVYLCAQDRHAAPGAEAPAGSERLLCLINAPANGDTHFYDAPEIEACQTRALETLRRCGVSLEFEPAQTHATTPSDFHQLFPATGGALYGPASHGWRASFNRPQARTRLPGLYLAGGSVHPGPGVPMAALSGRIAAALRMADLASTSKSRRVAMPGGISTH